MPRPGQPGNTDNPGFSTGVDYGSLTDGALAEEIRRLSRREREISFQRRFLHGQIQLARADLARRLTRDQPLDLSRTQLSELDRLLDGVDKQDER